MDNKDLEVSLVPYEQLVSGTDFDLDRIIYDLDNQIELLSSQADNLDYLVSVASGILCGMLDILWVGEFSLGRGREIASDKIEDFVKKAAKLTGCESDDLGSSVKHLEKLFPIPSDGNTPDFGGGLQHYLRDFAHHPTIVGLIFSLLTQFTYKSYGTDTAGMFLVVDVLEKSRPFIGDDTSTKILYGILTWFFHLVSDMAGSSSTAGKTGGTGIPGPILSLVKELSVLPFFRDMEVGEYGLSMFLSKLFNGTLLAQHDENGKIIKDTVLKFDLRDEMGVVAELGRQALPVIANECPNYIIHYFGDFLTEVSFFFCIKIRLPHFLSETAPFLHIIVNVAKYNLFLRQYFYSSICLPKNEEALCASFMSASLGTVLPSLHSIITLPVTSPAEIMG